MTRLRSLVTGLALATLLVAGAGCGNDGGELTESDEGDRVETAGTTPCPDRHMVVFDFFNVFTPANREEHEAVHWLQDPTDEPEPRPGGAEVAQRYRDLGYEILYVHAAPNNVMIGDLPITDAIEAWLVRYGFPVDEHARMWQSWNPDWEHDTAEMTPLALMTEELIRLGLDGVDVSFAYSGRPERVEAFIAGGVERERIYTVMEAAGEQDSTPIAGDDLQAHLAQVDIPADEICQAGR